MIGVANHIPGGYDLLGQDPPLQPLSGSGKGPNLWPSLSAAVVNSSPAIEP